MQLRSYQQDIINQINTSQSKRIIVSAPTGSGKAITLMTLAQQYTRNAKKVLLLVDRIQLVNQLSDTATKLGMSHNIIMGDKRYAQDSNYLTIASVQSWAGAGDYDLILIDECHTLYNPITSYLTHFKGLCVGFTATPFTNGLKEVYDTIINTVTQAELTASNTLCDIVAYEMVSIDMQGVKTVAGEYIAEDIRKRSHDIYGDVVNTLIDNLELQTDTLIFCANIKHCEDVKQQLNSNNINCGIYTSKQNMDERSQLLGNFVSRKCGILITVATLSKGFDCPQIKHILDLRPLKKSLAEYMQMLGRGTRIYDGKTQCKLIDFSGNYDRFCIEVNNVYHNGTELNNTTRKTSHVTKLKGGIKSTSRIRQIAIKTNGVIMAQAPLQLLSPIHHKGGKQKQIDNALDQYITNFIKQRNNNKKEKIA